MKAFSTVALLVLGYTLAGACLTGCGNPHLEAADRLAGVAILEARMPEREVVTIDHKGDQMRSWELDTREHELIPSVEIDAAVATALDALSSGDDTTHERALAILRKFAFPITESPIGESPSVIVGTPPTPRAALSRHWREWWKDNRTALRFYRKSAE